MADLSLSGLASGFDWKTVVDQLADLERAPETRLQAEQTTLSQRNSAYGNILTQITALKAKVDALKDPSLYLSHTSSVGDATILSGSADSSAAVGSYDFNIIQLATSSQQQGSSDIGKRLNDTNNVAGLVLSSAGLATAITPGTLTVSGQQVTIATTDTLEAVFNKISAATSGAVIGSYDAATDKITLSGTGEVVLGSATDTSNFFQVAKLYNNGTSTIASAASLGTVNLSAKVGAANTVTAITDGGSGAGEFKINGISISFNAATDTMAGLLSRINQSAAGVTASYDSTTDRFVLANKSTGDVGVALQDVTGNFLAATGLSGGALVRGKNALFTVNGGSTQVSRSNTISAADAGVPGVSVTALKEGTATLTVNSDSSKIKTAINDFLAAYNKAQALIDTNTASSTDAKGAVTAGVLASDSLADEIASKMRAFANQVVAGLSGTVKQLADLGINSNGTDNKLALIDSAKLDAALSNNLLDVSDLFSSSTGIAATLSAYLDKVSGDDGSLETKQTNLGKQITDINTQIADVERLVLIHKQQMTDEFVQMETAQAQINQQMQYLQRNFGQ